MIRRIFGFGNLNITKDFAAKKRREDISRKKLAPEVGPGYVTIDLTNKCNLTCIACWTYSPFLKEKKPLPQWFRYELPYDLVEKLVYDLKKLGTTEIRLTGGGEPFLHPRIFDIINLIKKKKFKLDITTNFTLLDVEKLRRLISQNIDNLTASLWAASPDTYAKTHPGQKPEVFGRIIKNLTYFNRKKKTTKTVIANVISNLNYMEIGKMAELAIVSGANEVYFTMVDPVIGATEHLLLSKKQKDELSCLFLKLINDHKSGKFHGLKIDNPQNFLRRIKNESMQKGEYDRGIVLNIPCTIGYTFSRILANGDVAPCCRAVMIPSGNLHNEGFIDIWRGERQRYFRDAAFNLNTNPGFIEKVGCIYTCDNLMQNIETYDKIKAKGFKP